MNSLSGSSVRPLFRVKNSVIDRETDAPYTGYRRLPQWGIMIPQPRATSFSTSNVWPAPVGGAGHMIIMICSQCLTCLLLMVEWHQRLTFCWRHFVVSPTCLRRARGGSRPIAVPRAASGVSLGA